MSKSPNERYTVAVDFDGVLHLYISPWVNPHTITDGPVPGALEWLHATLQDFDVVIYSTRCRTWRGRRAIRAWLRNNMPFSWFPAAPGYAGLEDVRLSYEKPKALIYIDDRAYRFDGHNLPSKDAIHAARPWNKPRRKGSNA